MGKKKAKKKKANARASHLTPEIAAIRGRLKTCLKKIYLHDSASRKVGNATFGIYAFLDYDSEPIYVGQTYEDIQLFGMRSSRTQFRRPGFLTVPVEHIPIHLSLGWDVVGVRLLLDDSSAILPSMICSKPFKSVQKVPGPA